MTNKVPMATLCSLLLVYTPVAAPAAATSPMLGQVMVNGQAKINGLATPSGATVFPGDRVATETNSVAELTLNGGSKVLLPESSAVVLHSEAARVIVNLNQGALAFLGRSSTPAFLDANGARIKPAADTAVVLEVAIRGNSLRVLTRRGSATVETADKILEVEEGKELDATMAPASLAASSGPASAGQGNLETWLLFTAAAAGITGLILGALAISRPNPASCTVVSPFGPGSIKCP